MPLPPSVLYPPFHVVRLSNILLSVRDLGAAKAFWGDTLGLQLTEETPDRLYFRGLEERGHHCVVLQRDEEPAARQLGFKLYAEEDLDKARHFFRAKGLKAEFVEEPFQGRTLRTTDPLGVPLESTRGWRPCRRSTRATRSTEA